MAQTVQELSQRTDKIEDRLHKMEIQLAEDRGAKTLAKAGIGLGITAILAVLGWGLLTFFEMHKDVAVHTERFNSVSGDVAQLRKDVDRLTDFVLKARLHMGSYIEGTIIETTDTEILVETGKAKERKLLKLSADVWVIEGARKLKPSDLKKGMFVNVRENEAGEVDQIEVTKDVSKLLAPPAKDKLPIPKPSKEPGVPDKPNC